MASSLAAFNFSIRKTAADGSILYTGPYIPTEFVERQSLTLSAYAGYREGPPQTSRILVRSIQDVNTRVLALQAGDVDIGNAILGLTALSFLGLGVQPPQAEWGAMINSARGFFDTQPWVMMAPGLAISGTVLAVNILGDALRHATDLRRTARQLSAGSDST